MPSPSSSLLRSSTMYSNAFSRQYAANGISLRLKLEELFQLPLPSLYLRSTDALSIVTVLPCTTASFSQMAQDACPARNLALGFVMFISSGTTAHVAVRLLRSEPPSKRRPHE